MFSKRNRLLAGGLFVAVTVCVAPLIAQQDRGPRRDTDSGQAQPAQARESASLNPNDISLDQAHAALEAATKKAQDVNTKMDICVGGSTVENDHTVAQAGAQAAMSGQGRPVTGGGRNR